jgi:hypothetical protein
MYMYAYHNLVMRSGSWVILVNDPMGPDPIRNTTFIEDQSLLCSNHVIGASSLDLPILTGDFPVAGLRRPVRPVTVGVLEITGTEEEPFMVI